MNRVLFSFIAWLSLAGMVSAEEAEQPGLLEFMSGYCEAILHIKSDAAGGVVADYWKIDDSDEQARLETLEYVKIRKLTEVAREQVVFLRVLTLEERDEILHFAAPIKDAELREKFDRPKFKYALVKLLPISDGSLEFLHEGTVPGSDAATEGPTLYSLEEFKALVLSHLAPPAKSAAAE